MNNLGKNEFRWLSACVTAAGILAAMAPATALAAIVSGTVFEDANFAGTASAYDGGGSDKALQGVDVELYNGATDAYIASTATAADGSYSFSGLADGSYKVRARSSTIGSATATPRGGLNGTVPGTWPNPLAELTWGDSAALYGGQSTTVDDTVTGNNGGPGDTWVSVTVSGADVGGVDFGFAFNLIVNTIEDSNADNTRSVQGGLRQFIKNSNAIANAGGTTANSSEFRIPISDPNYNAGTGVFTITPVILLPAMADSGTTLDVSTQGSNTTQTNAGNLGVGGKVGVDQLDLSTVPAPEVEIAGSETLPYGLRITASSGVLRGVAIYGFGLGNTGEGNVVVANSITGPLIEQNVIGSGAAAFSDPGSGFRGWENVYSGGANNGTIQNNLIGFGGIRGILLAGNSLNWTIDDNEIRDNSLEDPFGDGIAIDPGSADVTANLIIGSASQGVVVKGSTGSTFTNNTITGNGIGTASASGNAAGMTFRSTGSGHTVELNEFTANYGAGLSVNDGAAAIKVSKNSFSANGTIVARNSDPATGQIGIDLNNPSDDASAGTSPFVSLNDSGDTQPGGNNLLNYPVLDTALINGANLELTGWAPSDSVIEVFLRDPDPSLFGEGQTHRITLTENGTGAGLEDPYADLDTNPPSSYGPGAINGIVQGSDTTNRFRFVFPKPAAVIAGVHLTATARDGANNTSEFSGRVIVSETFQVSGTVFEDVNYGGGAGRDLLSASGIVRSGARVELYDATGTYVSFTTTDGSGNYNFSGLSPANYTVRVVNATVTSSRTGYTAALLGVQTYRTDASSGSAVPETARVGGQDPSVADAGNGSAGATMNTATGVFTAVVSGTAQSITDVALGAGSVVGVDFGFNYDTIVNINDDDQGSLRQFIVNANALSNAGLAQVGQTAGKEVSIFMIPVVQLTSGVAIIVPTSLMTPITGANAVDTSIDGTTQTVNIGNTNLGIAGTGFLGAGGTIGLGPDALAGTADEPVLSQVEAPEIEIRNVTNIRTGLDVQANSVTIRGIAIHGFGQNTDADIDGNIRVGIDGTTDYTGALIEKNIVGATAFNFVNPPITTDGDGLIVRGADGGILRNNLIGFSYRSGIKTHDDVNGWLIEDNEIRGNGTSTRYGDAIDLGQATATTTISKNLLIANGASGVDSYESSGSNTISNNTITGNGFAGQANQETSGIRLFGTDSDVTLNLIQNNFGAGVLVVGDGAALNQPSLRNKITRNSFSGNGSNAIDLLAVGGDQSFGDGITLNGGAANDCSYLTSTGNDGLEHPVITSAFVSAGSTTVVGQGCPSSDVEVYRGLAGSGDTNGGTDFGEGERYLGTTTTNATGDFSFVTTALVSGDAVTAIVIDASDNTSEFGESVAVTPQLLMIKRAFQIDGTPIGTGSTVPQGVPFKFLLYFDNPGSAVADVSLQDVLDPLFAYQAGSMKYDNTLVSGVVCPGGVCDEAAIFAQVNGAGTFLGDGDAVVPPTDADEGSYNAGTATIDVGNSNNPNNAQLDLATDRVWALVMTVVMQ